MHRNKSSRIEKFSFLEIAFKELDVTSNLTIAISTILFDNRYTLFCYQYYMN